MTKEDISITYENNVFYCTKNGTKWISVDGEKWYGEEKRIKELELELTVEKDQHQEEINLHLHAEDYIKSLEKENKTLEGCLLAEQEHTQMLREQIEEMKCCHNCDFIFKDGNCYYDKECKNKDHWKLRR